MVAPTLLATTTVPVGKVPVTPPVVTAIGVPVVWFDPGKPVIDAVAVTVALTGSGLAAETGNHELNPVPVPVCE